MADCNRGQEDYFPSQEHEATTTEKKYGALVPKKKPLISNDHERAFFDSADWALCKQGAGILNQKSTAAVETLRRKTRENTAPATTSKETCLYIWSGWPGRVELCSGIKQVG